MKFSNVLISGLRRSGTTAFWETFRKDGQSLCFDEPFNPSLWMDPSTNQKGTWTELLAVLQRESAHRFTEAVAINPHDELTPDITRQQKDYLRHLYRQHSRVVVDSVRVWSKLDSLADITESPLIIHLVRHPRSWVTAHLLPSSARPSYRRRLSNIYRRYSFFSRRGLYNNWHYQDIVEASFGSQSGEAVSFWHEIGKTAEEVARQPAYRRLLAFWWAAVLRTERQLAQLRAEQHVTVTMEEFQATPRTVFTALYEKAGWPVDKSLIFDHVTLSRAAWKNTSAHWREGMQWAGIPECLWSSTHFSGSAIKDAIGAPLDDHLA